MGKHSGKDEGAEVFVPGDKDTVVSSRKLQDFPVNRLTHFYICSRQHVVS